MQKAKIRCRCSTLRVIVMLTVYLRFLPHNLIRAIWKILRNGELL